MKQPPLYRALANTLRQQIAEGVWPQGGQLPPELELCASYEVSRHTARDALRLLAEEGLIARRRGAGTLVLRAQPLGPFSQDWGEVSDILQYARDARLHISHYGLPTPAEVAAMQLDPSLSWASVRGVRLRPEGGSPLALTQICVRADLMPSQADLEAWPEAIAELISRTAGVNAVRIEQAISAIVLDRDEAKALKEHAGDAALRTIRRYMDATGQVYQASVSIHPGNRFAYRMVIER
jgi:GntR family transcriptional regulator